MPFVFKGDGPSSANSYGTSSDQVTSNSETEGRVMEGLRKSLDHAGEVLARRPDLIKGKRTKVVWVNPLASDGEKGSRSHPYKTKKACQNDLDKNYSMRVEEMKLSDKPQSLYVPRRIEIKPKLTYREVYPEAAPPTVTTESQDKANERLAKKHSGNGTVTVAQMIRMPEHEAISKIDSLDDQMLVDLHSRSVAYGKRRLTKKLKEAASSRGVALLL